MKTIFSWSVIVLLLALSPSLGSGIATAQPKSPQASAVDDSKARPPVTSADLKIIKRAREILDSPAKWNRADNRQCPAAAKTLSLYCALEVATTEVSGQAEHRGAALQEARFVIDEIAANRNYEHRLMGYNNDPTTTFSDVQEILRIVESIFTMRLRANAGAAPVTSGPAKPAGSAVSQIDIEVVRRAQKILDSPAKWNRENTQQCSPDATTFNLYCALMKAAIEVAHAEDDSGPAFKEARRVIDETAPNHAAYHARLVDYNRDPATTFADVQKLLQTVADRLTQRVATQ